MSITYRNGVAVADLRDIGGPRQSLFTRNKDLARLLHNDIEQRVLRGEKITGQVVRAITAALTSPAAQATQVAIGVPVVVAPMAASRPTGLTLRKAFELARATRNKWIDAKDIHTIEANYQHVAAHFGAARTLDSITTSDMRAYLATMREQQLAASTMNARLSMVSVLFTQADLEGYPVEFPKINRVTVKREDVPPLTEAEENMVIAYFRNSSVPTDHIMADLVPVLLETGFRVSEALALRDGVTIDWETRMVRVRGHSKVDKRGTAKSSMARAVPMTDRVQVILRRRGPTPFAGLTLGRADKRWSLMRTGIGRGNDPLFKIHALRHTCCNRLVQRGMDTARIQQWMGHADIATTMLYVHGAGLNLDDLRDALQRYATCATIALPQSNPGLANQLETRIESQQLMQERI